MLDDQIAEEFKRQAPELQPAIEFMDYGMLAWVGLGDMIYAYPVFVKAKNGKYRKNPQSVDEFVAFVIADNATRGT